MRTIPDLSAELRGAVKSAGLTQEALREAAGVSRQTLTNVLKGTEDFKVSTLLAVADRLGLELLLLPKAAARGLQEPVAAPVVESMVDKVRKSLRSTDRNLRDRKEP
jgi:transcriptional regulator with XRE-family HTH domain